MQFLITAYDGRDEGALARRMSVRPQHLENVAKVKERGRVLCAGGIRDGDGRLVGSVLILEFETRGMLDEYLATEPYVTAGVWQDIRIETCSLVLLDDAPLA